MLNCRGESAEDMVFGIDRERAPAAATADMYVNGGASSLVG